jgi:hypothetical protein
MWQGGRMMWLMMYKGFCGRGLAVLDLVITDWSMRMKMLDLQQKNVWYSYCCAGEHINVGWVKQSGMLLI